MTLTRKDLAATLLTALAVLAFAATHESWGVPLIGDSHRWAAGTILLLGALTCGLGSRVEGGGMAFFAVLGTLALALGALALATGSLTALSLLVAAMVVLWGAATVRHLWQGHASGKPLAT
jgi:hypothetical protein